MECIKFGVDHWKEMGVFCRVFTRIRPVAGINVQEGHVDIIRCLSHRFCKNCLKLLYQAVNIFLLQCWIHISQRHNPIFPSLGCFFLSPFSNVISYNATFICIRAGGCNIQHEYYTILFKLAKNVCNYENNNCLYSQN